MKNIFNPNRPEKEKGEERNMPKWLNGALSLLAGFAAGSSMILGTPNIANANQLVPNNLKQPEKTTILQNSPSLNYLKLKQNKSPITPQNPLANPPIESNNPNIVTPASTSAKDLEPNLKEPSNTANSSLSPNPQFGITSNTALDNIQQNSQSTTSANPETNLTIS